MRPAALVSCFCLVASYLHAQEVGAVFPSGIQTTNGAVTMTFSAREGMSVGVPVTGKPYSAQQVHESVQTLADGTHIRRNEQTVMMYRDSLGRTRTERAMMGGPYMTDQPKYVQIVDVVGGYQYTIDDVNRVAHRVAIQVRQPIQPAARRPAPSAAGMGAATAGAGVASRIVAAGPLGPSSGRPRPEIQNEDLGTQIIEGVTAHGRRMTQTWPVDSVGNDRPIVSVNEFWSSDQLGGIMVLSKNSDPRSGESTTALKNISLAEPDPALFQPPPGYQIVDENGPFKISVPSTQTQTAPAK